MKKILFLLIMLLSIPLSAKTWYVNVANASTASNSYADSACSVKNGLTLETGYGALWELYYRQKNNIASGDIIYIAPGDYDVSTIYPTSSQTVWNGVTTSKSVFYLKSGLKIISLGKVTFSKSNNGSNGSADQIYWIRGCSNTEIRGITFKNIDNSGYSGNPYMLQGGSYYLYGCNFDVGNGNYIFNNNTVVDCYDCTFNIKPATPYTTLASTRTAIFRDGNDKIYFNHCSFIFDNGGVIWIQPPGGSQPAQVISFTDCSLQFSNSTIKNAFVNVSTPAYVDLHAILKWKNCTIYNMDATEYTTNVTGASTKTNLSQLNPKMYYDGTVYEILIPSDSPVVNKATDGLNEGALNSFGIIFRGK